LSDKIVSVRMPVTLVDELKVMTSKNHYMDVSETIRGLLRQRLLEQKSPVQSKVNQIKNQLGKITDHEQITALKKTLQLLEDINEL
jgi:metal-responsive CopG/Arc/MetJ family transcriptional regulator